MEHILFGEVLREEFENGVAFTPNDMWCRWAVALFSALLRWAEFLQM